MAAVDVNLSVVDGAGQVQVGTVVYRPRGTYGPRAQANYQLVLLHRGAVTVEIDGRPARLASGEVALLKPGHREYFRFAREEESHHSWLALQRPPLPAPQLAALDEAPFALPISRAMACLLETCLALHTGRGAPRAPLVALVAAALLMYVDEACTSGRSGEANRQHPAVAAAQDVVRRRFHHPLRLDDLAAEVHVAPEHLIRLFRQETDTTPMRFLWEERVRYGIHLLEHTGLPLAEIAAQAGFRTVYHFSRRIRAAAGVPPTELRRRAWAPRE
jgi:AraC family transcriptional regulator of arabinose operon